ncbi:MAG: hypothetical protein JW881_10865 [Spirochaetales bacterium]|nr:hypothetical protein [Spirochaetales bacterium]
MKQLSLCLFFIAGLPLFLHSQENYSFETITFLPPMYYIGDEVELRLKVVIPDNYEITKTEREINNEWIDVKRILIFPPRKREGKKIYEVRIFFVSFKPGNLSLPDIPLGVIVLKDIQIDTLSVFTGKQRTEKLTPPRGQLELPYTWVKIGLIVLLIILVSVLFVILIVFLPRWMMFARNLYLKNLPVNKLRRGLAKLKRECASMHYRDFFIGLSVLIREYLNNRLYIPALTSTTAEISRVSSASIMEAGVGREIVKILTLSDFIKFGGRVSNEGEMCAVIDKVHFLVDTIEEEKKHVEP